MNSAQPTLLLQAAKVHASIEFEVIGEIEAASLEVRKIYRVVRDSTARAHRMVRVIGLAHRRVCPPPSPA